MDTSFPFSSWLDSSFLLEDNTHANNGNDYVDEPIDASFLLEDTGDCHDPLCETSRHLDDRADVNFLIVDHPPDANEGDEDVDDLFDATFMFGDDMDASVSRERINETSRPVDHPVDTSFPLEINPHADTNDGEDNIELVEPSKTYVCKTKDEWVAGYYSLLVTPKRLDSWKKNNVWKGFSPLLRGTHKPVCNLHKRTC